jgi:hypothetical protein
MGNRIGDLPIVTACTQSEGYVDFSSLNITVSSMRVWHYEALYYKAEGSGFETRWVNEISQFT